MAQHCALFSENGVSLNLEDRWEGVSLDLSTVLSHSMHHLMQASDAHILLKPGTFEAHRTRCKRQNDDGTPGRCWALH